MSVAISVQHLQKRYGELVAINDISFDVETGSLFALLGENGAGKSTTINILCAALRKDSGQVLIDGYHMDQDLRKAKEKIGVVYQSSVLDGKLSVQANLKARAALYGITGIAFKERLAEVNQCLHLQDLLKRRLDRLSGGQRRRVDIARALIHNPSILFLDEPTTGLDPQTRNNVWEVLDSLRKERQITIFLTTHYMEEAARADNVVILDHGAIVAQGSPAALKSQYSFDALYIYCSKNLLLEQEWQQLNLPFTYHAGSYRVRLQDRKQALVFLKKHPELTDFEIIKGNMDDVFLNITGKELQ